MIDMLQGVFWVNPVCSMFHLFLFVICGREPVAPATIKGWRRKFRLAHLNL